MACKACEERRQKLKAEARKLSMAVAAKLAKLKAKKGTK